MPELISGKSENACPCPSEYVMVSEPVHQEQPRVQHTWELVNGLAGKVMFCLQTYFLFLAPQLIRKCRAQTPTHRPSFEQVNKYLHKINPNKVSPVDMMMTLVQMEIIANTIILYNGSSKTPKIYICLYFSLYYINRVFHPAALCWSLNSIQVNSHPSSSHPRNLSFYF